MAALSCPYPANVNPLTPNGFMLSIDKLPKVKYFCQSASVPELSFGSVVQASPFSDIENPSEKLIFAPLTIQFLVDENMENYISIYDWMKGIGRPTDHDEYNDFINLQPSYLPERAKIVSDGTLAILGSNFAVVRTLKFVDLFPVSLSSLDFQSTNTDVRSMVGVVSFKLHYYEFV